MSSARRGVFILPIVVSALLADGPPEDRGTRGPDDSRIASLTSARLRAVANVPMAFEPNRGQGDPRAAFVARGRGYAIEIGATSARLHLTASGDQRPAALDMEVLRASPAARTWGENPLPGRSHYFIGSDPAQYFHDVPHVARVETRGVLPGIDVAYYGNQGTLEYDFIIAPGADPTGIALRFHGQDSMALSDTGDLVFRFGGRELRQPKPVLYQLPGREPVEGRFVIGADGAVGFAVDAWDAARTLVIDPVLVFTSHVGGTGADTAGGVAVDSAGSIYITGTTTAAPGFPLQSPLQPAYAGGASDAFVTKFNAAGTAIVYSTYIGSNDADEGRGIAVDAAGRAYLTGSTTGSFPGSSTVCNGSDGFIVRVEAAGNLLGYSRCFGTAGLDWGNAVAVDASNRASVTGLWNGADAFVGRVNATGTTLTTSMLGGAGFDEGFGIAADSAGNLCVVGQTSSANFPFTSAVQPALGSPHASDAFVAKYDAMGTILYATYLGGSDADNGSGAAIDGAGNCYVTGSTRSSNFPISNAAQASPGGTGDAFAAAFNTSGAFIYSTYLGGARPDNGAAIAVAFDGTAQVTGSTESQDFPVLGPTQPELNDVSLVLASFNLSTTPTFTRTTLTGHAVTSMVVDHYDAETAYVGTTDGLFKTSDGGVQWTRIDSGFPSSHVTSLVMQIDLSCDLFVGLETDPASGVTPRPLALSKDCGETWSFVSLGMATSVRSLAWTSGNFDPFRVLYAATVTVDSMGTVQHGIAQWAPSESDPPLVSAPGAGDYVFVRSVLSGQDCRMYAGDSAGRVYHKQNCESTTWDQIGGTLPGRVLALEYLPDGQNDPLLAATTAGIFRKAGQGVWTNVLSVGSPISALAKQEDFWSTLFAGATNGTLYKSTDRGLTWAAVASIGSAINGVGVSDRSLFKVYVTTAIAPDAFLTTFSSAGARLGSTWIGGQGSDRGRAVALAPGGHAVVVGTTAAANFPAVGGAFSTSGGGDAFVAKINPIAGPNLMPTLTQLSPANVAAGGPAFLLTVTGTNFLSGSVVRWNGLPRPTTFVDSTHLNASISAGDIALAGSPLVTVFNPEPGGGISNVLTMGFSPPVLTLDKTTLNFGVHTAPRPLIGGTSLVRITGPQTVRLTKSGAGPVEWVATPTAPGIIVSPSSGTGSAVLTISMTSVLLGGPPSSGTVTFTVTGAANAPGPIKVDVTRSFDTWFGNPEIVFPFGVVDTPTNNIAGITGAIPFTGWALDELEVERIMICRAAFGAEVAPVDQNCAGQAQIFVGFGVFIDGARPDVQAAYPDYPRNTRGGWGFMVLTNMLPAQGNGTYDFYVYAKDQEGRTTLLGTRRLTCDNAHATKPFGSIDTPEQGGVASSASYVNFGWALTQAHKIIPIDGSTIQVLVDGAVVGTVDYNHFRPDIASAFPGLQNSSGAVGFRILDTTKLTNGLHTISWTVTDNQGVVEGIGSRFFTVSNDAAAPVTAGTEAEARAHAVDRRGLTERVAVATREASPLVARHGWDLSGDWRAYAIGHDGRAVIRGEEVDRFEVWLGEPGGERLSGYLQAGDTLAPLPVGSQLDAETGLFTWAPGAGFVGTYDLVFVRWAGEIAVARQDVRVILAPKAGGRR